jgi:hypothetical protein
VTQIIVFFIGSISIFSLYLLLEAACTKAAIDIILEQPILFEVLNDINRPAARLIAKQNRMFKRFRDRYNTQEPSEVEAFLCYRIAADIKEHLLAID